MCRHKSEACSSSSSDSDSSMDEDDRTMEELMAKKQHPQRLHPEMWFNDPGEVNILLFKYFIMSHVSNIKKYFQYYR